MDAKYAQRCRCGHKRICHGGDNNQGRCYDFGQQNICSCKVFNLVECTPHKKTAASPRAVPSIPVIGAAVNHMEDP